MTARTSAQTTVGCFNSLSWPAIKYDEFLRVELRVDGWWMVDGPEYAEVIEV